MGKKNTAVGARPPRSEGRPPLSDGLPFISKEGAEALMRYVEDGRAQLSKDTILLRSQQGFPRP